MFNGSRVALVHDFLVDMRGAERVFLALCDLFPRADLFTAVYDRTGPRGASPAPVHTSFLRRMRPSARTFRALLPLYPRAMESLDLRGYDLVVSSSSASAHGVSPTSAPHVCYCHNPFRYAWNARQTLAGRAARGARGARGGVPRWRQLGLDRRPARRRLRRQLADDPAGACRYFGRDATLHPPVDVERFAPPSPAPPTSSLSELMPTSASTRRARLQPTAPATGRRGQRPTRAGSSGSQGRPWTFAGARQRSAGGGAAWSARARSS